LNKPLLRGVQDLDSLRQQCHKDKQLHCLPRLLGRCSEYCVLHCYPGQLPRLRHGGRQRQQLRPHDCCIQLWGSVRSHTREPVHQQQGHQRHAGADSDALLDILYLATRETLHSTPHDISSIYLLGNMELLHRYITSTRFLAHNSR
jgi:hypothetical protein